MYVVEQDKCRESWNRVFKENVENAFGNIFINQVELDSDSKIVIIFLDWYMSVNSR